MADLARSFVLRDLGAIAGQIAGFNMAAVRGEWDSLTQRDEIKPWVGRR